MSPVQTGKPPLFFFHGDLSELDRITRDSLPAPESPPAGEKPPGEPPATAYQSDNPNYQAALKCDALIQALLDFHRQCHGPSQKGS